MCCLFVANIRIYSISHSMTNWFGFIRCVWSKFDIMDKYWADDVAENTCIVWMNSFVCNARRDYVYPFKSALCSMISSEITTAFVVGEHSRWGDFVSRTLDFFFLHFSSFRIPLRECEREREREFWYLVCDWMEDSLTICLECEQIILSFLCYSSTSQTVGRYKSGVYVIRTHHATPDVRWNDWSNFGMMFVCHTTGEKWQATKSCGENEWIFCLLLYFGWVSLADGSDGRKCAAYSAVVPQQATKNGLLIVCVCVRVLMWKVWMCVRFMCEIINVLIDVS